MRVQEPTFYTNIFNYVNLRQESGSARLSNETQVNFSALHLPEALRESELKFGETDKIFAAEWLNEDHIICGTKCNKVSCWLHCLILKSPLIFLCLIKRNYNVCF